MASTFLSSMLEARTQWNKTFKILRENNIQLIETKYECEIFFRENLKNVPPMHPFSQEATQGCALPKEN